MMAETELEKKLLEENDALLVKAGFLKNNEIDLESVKKYLHLTERAMRIYLIRLPKPLGILFKRFFGNFSNKQDIMMNALNSIEELKKKI